MMSGDRMQKRLNYKGLAWVVLVLGLGGCLVLVGVFWGRLAAVPFYVQTALNKLEPTAVVPSPPPVSGVDVAGLLATRPGMTPTTISESSPTAAASPVATAADGLATATLVVPTATPWPSPVPTLPASVRLTGFVHDWQTWNNCGPTTISMNLSYFGELGTQVEAAQFLKPNGNDKNVNPAELAAYAETLGFVARVEVGGSVEGLQRLLASGFPVIVEMWLDPEDAGGLGHYRLLTGYDGAEGVFLAQDSLRGADIVVPMGEFDVFWRVFNRKYVVVSRPEQVGVVAALLSPAGASPALALQTAQNEASQTPTDPYAWFNIGTSYTALGEYELAASAFDEARRIGLPYRMLWYQFEPFQAYLAVGRYQEVIDLASATLQGTGGLEELYYYRGLARRALGQEAQAVADFQAALEYNANFQPAADELE